jgi:hypothetical protein
MIKSLPQRVREQLQYYVYLYIDPRDNKVFYIGKGKGDRILSHLTDSSDTEKAERIRELKKLNLEPRLEILKYGLKNEHEAFLVESTAIDLVDFSSLTNLVRGHGADKNGRSRLTDLIDELNAVEVEISEPVLLININQSFNYGMTEIDLYDITRGIWSLDPTRAQGARYAFAVYRGVVREVYLIAHWLPAGSTQYFHRSHESLLSPTRYEFVGRIADETMRNKYRAKSVRNLWAHAQNPINYINC